MLKECFGNGRMLIITVGVLRLDLDLQKITSEHLKGKYQKLLQWQQKQFFDREQGLYTEVT